MNRILAFCRSEKGRVWLLGFLLAASIIIAYKPVWNAGFIWDDDDYVIKNQLLTAPDGLKRIWFSFDSPSQYFPLTYTTFRIERSVWGLNATGYHWVNILLHAINALLVWRLLWRLKVPGAWLAAALFALHPVQVESVAWVTERKNVLSLFFFLLALLSWVKFIDEQPRKSWLPYGLALIFYALALFSKTTACTLPAALLLTLWLKEKPIDRWRLAQIVPFIVIGLGMGLVTIWWERFHQGTEGKPFAFGPLDRLLIASRAFWFYVGKLIWPAKLTFSYPHWDINPANPLAYGGLIAGVILAAVILLVRRRVGRGLEVGVLFFALTLAPVLGFVMLYTFLWSFVADHYQYVACIGLLALAAVGMLRLFNRLRSPVVKYAFCTLLLFTLGTLTWRQSRMYAGAETLWRATLARNPESWLANYNLGTILGGAGRADEAILYFQKTIEIHPQFTAAHYNLGCMFLYKGQLDAAMEEFHKILQEDPRYALAWFKLGVALAHKGQLQEAIPDLQKALEISPDCVDAHRSLAQVWYQQGHFDDAITQFEQTINLQANNADDYVYLGNAFLQKGKTDEALASFQRALVLKPDALAYNNIGNALLQKGHVREAAANFRKALELQPHYLLAENNLAYVLATSPDASLRDGAKAVETAEDADRLAGGQNPVVVGTLAAAYAEAGRFPDAIAATKRGQQIATAQNRPDLVNAFQMQQGLYQAGQPFRAPANPAR